MSLIIRSGLSFLSLSGLPPVYTPLDFLEFTGTQYLKLDLPITKDTVCRIKFEMAEATGNCIIGSFDNFRFFNANGSAYLDWGRNKNGGRINGGSIRNNTSYYIEIGNFYVKDLDKDKIIISDTPRKDTIKYSSDPIQLMYLPYIRPDTKAKGKVLLVEIIEKGERVRFLLPHTSDTGETGLYDVVTDTFYGIIDTTTASTMTEEGGE